MTHLRKLLTHDEVARLLDVHPKTILRWGREGRLPRYKVGRKVRFAEADVDAFLAEHYGAADPCGVAVSVETPNPRRSWGGAVIPMRRHG